MDEIERGELCGTTLDGRYQLRRRIGVGGTGVVFEARSLRDGSAVAIKTLRPCYVNHIDLGTRLRREAEVTRRVAHPGIVRVLDEGTLEDGSPYIVMPLLQGDSLARWLGAGKRLNPLELAAICTRVAAILHSAHASGYVHRDVKPEHILLDRTPHGELLVQLLDFGVCASQTAPADEKARENGRVFGTPSYVSPEQASGESDVDGRADLFSLGVVMFEALCGRLPFTGATVSKLLLRIIRDPAPRVSELRPDIDPGLDLIVARLMARERCDRLPSARALSRALAPYLVQRTLIERRLAAAVSAYGLIADNAITERSALPAQRVA
ncbi:MAG TPA: serine/threonine-protein kinase [Polyangiales bacterium]|nr:serine/threonine-protein kinase [Polyangiales bacterium]